MKGPKEEEGHVWKFMKYFDGGRGFVDMEGGRRDVM